MNRRAAYLLIALIIVAAVGVYWLASTLPGKSPAANETTLPVQEYALTVTPQATLTIAKMYYTLNGIHALVIQASSTTDIVVSQVASDARTYNMTSFIIRGNAAWFIIPGWNCGYSNDNGRAETTQLISSNGTIYSLNYDCFYPPTGTNVTFAGLISPVHAPCTYVGSSPAICTSLVD